jgi:hypothetical protein
MHFSFFIFLSKTIVVVKFLTLFLYILKIKKIKIFY